MKFWRIFESKLGPAGAEPASYWHGGLGNAYVGPGLRPGDIGDLTPAQLLGAHLMTEGDDG